jgi:hypothetical protein
MPYSLHQDYLYQRLGISQDSNKHHLAEEVKTRKEDHKGKNGGNIYITGMKL